MHLCETRQSSINSGDAFTVTLTLHVDDAKLLWDAAAEKALQAPGATVSTVLDTLGPREDPSIADCITMLTAPAAIAGCTLADFGLSPHVAPLTTDASAATRLTLMSANG